MTSMKDAEVFYRERDTEIKTVVERLEVVTKTFGGHTLFDPQEIITANEDEVIYAFSKTFFLILYFRSLSVTQNFTKL